MQNGITESEYLHYLELIGKDAVPLVSWEETVRQKINGIKNASCVVINANPFTIGHRYLIEIASRRSTAVIVFVIQGKPESGGKGNHESTGIEFPFEERLEMTENSLSDMENVIVLPSGPYLISRDGFPEGYLKDRFSKASAHAVLDSMLLCRVCGDLKINLMFAGDEPRDELSEIHLNALRKECAASGITLRVAERKRYGEKYISSSMVRQCMADGNIRQIKELVPLHVLKYISARHSAQGLAVSDSLDVDQIGCNRSCSCQTEQDIQNN